MTSEGSLFDAHPAAFGRYQVLHQIGAGSLGPVFRANDPSSRQPVAVKVLAGLPPERARPVADALEALVDAAPHHPAAVRPLEAGLHEGTPYLVSSYAPGQPLDAALREYGPAAISDALPRLRAIAEALDEAAHGGLCHGALHPRDILVSADETRLTGLGLAGIVARAGADLPVRRPYTAPEVADGQAPSAEADQFALAAIAYEWLFGRRVAGPSNGESAAPQLPGVAAEPLDLAFRSALAPDPQDRFESCVAFVDALAAAVEQPEEGRPARKPRSRRAPRPAVPALPLGLPAEDDGPALLPDRPVVEVEPADVADVLRLEQAADDDPPAAGGPTAWDDEDQPDDDLRLSASQFDQPGEPDGEEAAVEAPLPAVAAPAPPDRDDDDYGHDDAESPGEPDSSTLYGRDEPGNRQHGPAALAGVLLIGLLVGAGVTYLATRGSGPSASEPAAAPMAVPADAGAPPTEAPATGGTVTDPPVVPAPVSPPASPPAATAAPTPAPAVPVVEGRLLIRTTPAGAAVTVDGEPAGETPLTLRDLPLGTRTVRITRAGFAAVERRVALTRERPSRSLEIRLAAEAASAPARPPAPATRRPTAPAAASARTGTMEVVSRPAGATVLVNGRARGQTPLTLGDLAPGTYTVRIERPGYRAWETTTTVTAGGRARVAASLQGGQGEE
ncbi:MAG: PEGA domain-containing protein [Vicinamibacterales bacterium]